MCYHVEIVWDHVIGSQLAGRNSLGLCYWFSAEDDFASTYPVQENLAVSGNVLVVTTDVKDVIGI